MGLMFSSISATVLEITWTTPQVTNGVVLSYSVLIDTHADFFYQKNFTGDQRSVLVTKSQ